LVFPGGKAAGAWP